MTNPLGKHQSVWTVPTHFEGDSSFRSSCCSVSSQKQLCISPMQNIRVLSKVQKDSGPCTDTDFAIYSAQRSHTKLSALGVMQ